MEHKNELKIYVLNNSMQFSEKLLNHKILLTDYNINNENETENNSKKYINKNHLSQNMNKSSITYKKKIK